MCLVAEVPGYASSANTVSGCDVLLVRIGSCANAV